MFRPGKTVKVSYPAILKKMINEPLNVRQAAQHSQTALRALLEHSAMVQVSKEERTIFKACRYSSY